MPFLEAFCTPSAQGESSFQEQGGGVGFLPLRPRACVIPARPVSLQLPPLSLQRGLLQAVEWLWAPGVISAVQK